MNCFSKILAVINKYFCEFRVLKIKANLLVIFSLYSIFLLITLLLYGYSNLRNVAAYKKESEIVTISQKVRHIASKISAEKDMQSIESEIQKSGMLNSGTFVLVDHNGKVLLSTSMNGSKLPDLSGLLEKIDNPYGVLDNFNFGQGNQYTFYEKIFERNLTLLHIVPAKFFERDCFPVVNFILFSSILCVIMYLIIILRFKNRIYNPIVNVEKIIHGIVEGDTDLGIGGVKEDSFLYPLYTDLKIMMDRLKDLIFREYNANIMKKQAELDALQSQINPHFLYNTLESIRGQAITHGMDDIEIMTNALSELFRYSISNKGNLVSLEEELKNVDNYLMIQQYRFNNKFIVVNKVEADTLSYRIPRLLIQPIVENAIYHGLETKIGKGTVTIKAYRTAKRLVVNIQDDGLGISYDKLVEINEILVKGQADIKTKDLGLRIGLINVNERIKLNFGDEYGLRVYSAKGVGTTVEIILPLINE